MSSEEENPYDYLEYWINSIQIKAPNSDIIIVGTHLDLRKREIPKEILKKYGNIIKKIFSVSCISNGEGINELREYIIQLTIDRLIEIPTSYIKLIDCLKNINDDFIDKTKLIEFIKKNGINFDNEEGEFETSLFILHNLGYILYYPPTIITNNDDNEKKQNSNNNDFIILKPQWLIDVFKSVVTVTNNDQIINGWLYHATLDKIWPKFKKEIHLFLLQLLERFKISIKSHGLKSLIPCRLEKIPSIILDDKIFKNKLLRRIQFLEILPIDLFPRLIASKRIFPFLDSELQNIWKDGVILKDDDYSNSTLLLKSNNEGRFIDIIGEDKSTKMKFTYEITNIIQNEIFLNWKGKKI
jgi:hypothetical protein